MSVIKKIGKIIKFLQAVYRDRYTIQLFLESKNAEFLKFSPPGHFLSPIPDMRNIDSQSDMIFDRSAKSLPSVILNDEKQVLLAKSFSRFYSELPFADKKAEGLRYFLDNSYFSYGDGVILYSFLRHYSPKRVIEIGSGYSSALMLDTNDLFLNKEVEFTFIEPFPDRLQTLLTETDRNKVKIEVNLVQDIELGLYSSLEENDILFIDSSHVAKINSDVLHIIFHILPLLKKGVIIHFHDILWPFEYPENWLKEGRAWNEAYFLHAFLQNNTAFEILYLNSYMELHHTDTLEEFMPKALKIPSSKVTPGNTSLWLRKLQ